MSINIRLADEKFLQREIAKMEDMEEAEEDEDALSNDKDYLEDMMDKGKFFIIFFSTFYTFFTATDILQKKSKNFVEEH